jgi:hypothetical protein
MTDEHHSTDHGYVGRAFYAPAHDALAYLLSGIACAALVAYLAMLVAWVAAGGVGS